MNLKSNKGYSLVEIGIGLLVLTIFLLFSVGLINGCYNNYRRIKQRNIAIDRAVYHVERLLQTDPNVLTGLLIEEVDSNNKTVVVVNPFFKQFVHDNFNKTGAVGNLQFDFKNRYAAYRGVSKDSITSVPTSAELEDYIKTDIAHLSLYFIQYICLNYTEVDNLKTGDYAFLNEEGVINTKNEVVLNNEVAVNGEETESYQNSNNKALRIKKLVQRIPMTSDGEVFGNDILKIRVEVFYPKNGKVPKKNINLIRDEEMDSIVIETIKVTR